MNAQTPDVAYTNKLDATNTITMMENNLKEKPSLQKEKGCYKFYCTDLSASQIEFLGQIQKKPIVKDLFVKRSGTFIAVFIVFHPSAIA